jgi:hypothetical protein
MNLLPPFLVWLLRLYLGDLASDESRTHHVRQSALHPLRNPVPNSLSASTILSCGYQGSCRYGCLTTGDRLGLELAFPCGDPETKVAHLYTDTHTCIPVSVKHPHPRSEFLSSVLLSMVKKLAHFPDFSGYNTWSGFAGASCEFAFAVRFGSEHTRVSQ